MYSQNKKTYLTVSSSTQVNILRENNKHQNRQNVPNTTNHSILNDDKFIPTQQSNSPNADNENKIHKTIEYTAVLNAMWRKNHLLAPVQNCTKLNESLCQKRVLSISCKLIGALITGVLGGPVLFLKSINDHCERGISVSGNGVGETK